MNSGPHIWKNECVIALSGIVIVHFHWMLMTILQMALHAF